MNSTLLIALAAMLWGGDFLLRHQVLAAGWSPARVVLGEHLLLTVVFSAVLWRGRSVLSGMRRADWLALMAVSWGGSALATWLYTLAFTLGSPLVAVLLQKTQPIFALLLAGWLLGERRAPGFWLLCISALIGAGLLTGITHLPSAHDLALRQAVCALGASALWGGATVAGRRLTPILPPPLLAGARFALAVPLLAVFALCAPTGHITSATEQVDGFVFLLLIVLLPDLLGMVLYYRGLRGTPASIATLAELCYPLTALLIGITVLHTSITLTQWLGLLMLIAAVLALGRRPNTVSAEAAVGIIDPDARAYPRLGRRPLPKGEG